MSTAQTNSAPTTPAPEHHADKRLMLAIIGFFSLALIAGGTLIYFTAASRVVTIEKSKISAPLVTLGPSAPGVLQSLSVHEGDTILPNAVVAQVGNEMIKSKNGGYVVGVENDIGKRVNPGEAVVTVIDPKELRVVGSLEENKGLQDVHVGQSVTFTVDAFDGKAFSGIVDAISPTSQESGIVFNISDKRETKIFDIKIRYDVSAYPELKNGMSAKVKIQK